MAAEGADGVPLSGMDSDWTVVPLSSDFVGQPWLMEYLLTFTTTDLWAGKLSVISQATHVSGVNTENNVYHTGMPSAHQVYIPAPKKLLIVMLDESTYAQATTITLPNIPPIAIYRGVRIATNQAPFAQSWVDIQNGLYNLWTDNNYRPSCQNMVRCLQFMESRLCTSMAFQLAVTLAAEISSLVPESPRLFGNIDARYQDDLSGAWTIGAHNFNNRAPLHTCSNIDEGTIAQTQTRIRRLLHGFNYGTTSPMQQHAHSHTVLAHEQVIVDNLHYGTATYWQAQTPETVQDQYQCNTANSVYRILLGLGLILKDDYSYSFKTIGGLQNVVTMQGVCLTLSLGIALSRSDVTRRAWSGLGINDAPVSITPIRNLISDLCQGMVIPLNTDTMMAGQINGNFRKYDEIDTYYGIDPRNEHWGLEVCMLYPAFLQWALKFNIDMIGTFDVDEGVITANFETPHLTVKHTSCQTASWLGTTLDSFRYRPAVYLDYQRTAPAQSGLSIEDWQEATASEADGPPDIAGYTSNLRTLGLKHHYRHVTEPGKALIVNKYAMRSGQHMWEVKPMQYPDPPNSDFLAKRKLESLPAQKEGSHTLPPIQIKETETKDTPPGTEAPLKE